MDTEMATSFELPDQVVELLGEDAQRKALEAVLIVLIAKGELSVARAGEILGLDRAEAIEWWGRHGGSWPNLTVDEFRANLRRVDLSAT